MTYAPCPSCFSSIFGLQPKAVCLCFACATLRAKSRGGLGADDLECALAGFARPLDPAALSQGSALSGAEFAIPTQQKCAGQVNGRPAHVALDNLAVFPMGLGLDVGPAITGKYAFKVSFFARVLDWYHARKPFISRSSATNSGAPDPATVAFVPSLADLKSKVRKTSDHKIYQRPVSVEKQNASVRINRFVRSACSRYERNRPLSINERSNVSGLGFWCHGGIICLA